MEALREARHTEPTARARGATDLHVRYRVSRPREHERPALLAWLNRGLRDGRPGRLEAEFEPVLFGEEPSHDVERHVLVRHRDRFASHCLIRTIPVEALGRRIELGMIGMVYTDPAERGRGAARLAIEEGIALLARSGAGAVVLWSDLDDFYTRLGFHRTGIENFYLLDAQTCEAAYGKAPADLEVRPAAECDFGTLEALYARKPCRHVRRSGELARLARAPDCEVLVATRASEPVAYASMGRGDDLTGVVHEWAGTAEGFGACLQRFAAGRRELTLLEGAVHENATVALRRAGARPHPGSFGLMRILDVDNLWEALTRGRSDLGGMRLRAGDDRGADFVFENDGRELPLAHAAALSLLFGPALPRPLALGLDAEARRRLARHLPWPLFIWGFDSI